MANDAKSLYRGAVARFTFWLVAVSAATLLTLLAGVGVAVVLGRQGAAGDWSRWSDVGQTFGVLSSIISGLALVAVLLTARVQFRELQRSAAAELSMLHLEILKMSINDPQLAEVWPAFRPGLPAESNRQFLYANIIYQFHWTSLKLNKATDEEVLGSMRYLFTSRLMREYWAAAERARISLKPGSPEFAFTNSAAITRPPSPPRIGVLLAVRQCRFPNLAVWPRRPPESRMIINREMHDRRRGGDPRRLLAGASHLVTQGP